MGQNYSNRAILVGEFNIKKATYMVKIPPETFQQGLD